MCTQFQQLCAIPYFSKDTKQLWVATDVHYSAWIIDTVDK